MPNRIAKTNFMLIKLLIIGLLIILLAVIYFFLPYPAVNKNKSDNYYFNFLRTKVHYIPMGNSFELGNYKINSVDLKSAEIIGRNYLKDKSHVYYKYLKIKNADPGSFEILFNSNSLFAKDKNMIYFEGHSFKDVDVKSVQFAEDTSGGPIFKDKNHLCSTYSFDFYADENYIIPPVQNIDPNKYQFLSDQYGKDDEVAYFKASPIIGSDAKSFILLREYAKDAHCVYLDGLQIRGIDPATFTTIEGGTYTKDKNGVYYLFNCVEDKDGKQMYFSAEALAGADPESFIMIKGEKIDYAKDKSKYYWGGKVQ